MKAIMVKNTIVSLENFFEAEPISENNIVVRYTTGHVNSADVFVHNKTNINTAGLENRAVLNKIYEIVTGN